MSRDIEVDDLAACMAEHDKDKERLKPDGRHNEEIH
jgi:hypothetical protein